MKRLLNGMEIEMTEAEIAELEASRITQWDKAAYERELNAAHDAWFNAIIIPLEYKSVEEIPLWLDDEDYDTEAAALKSLYRQSWNMLKAHMAEVTEASANVVAFIQSLPKFESPE